MKNQFVAFTVLLLGQSAFAYQALSPSQSICLESASNAAIRVLSSKGEFHLTRDQKTGLVDSLFNLDTEESFELAYLARLDARHEFISFENSARLLNLFATIQNNGKCALTAIRFEKNNGGH